MKPDMILQSDILDILFEGRNKDYGAYSLRRNYNGRLTKALSAMLLQKRSGYCRRREKMPEFPGGQEAAGRSG